MMKKFKILSVMLCCMAAMTLMSCNDDDSSSSLTKEDVAQCFAAIKGVYTGKVVYGSVNANNTADITDTLDVQWSAGTDSTLVIANFPAKLLAQNITNTELKAALSAAPNQNITCHTVFMQVSPITFLLNPVSPSYQLTYGGATHKVQVAFYINNYSSYGFYDTSKKMMEFQLVEGAIFVDGQQTSYLGNGVSFVFTGTKL
jgi:hypothetical protein